jgi:hypothetical protein
VGRVNARTGGRGTPYEGGELRPPLTWMEAWSIARQDLRLGDDEWLEMTPRMLHALRKRQIEQMQREELLVGILASTTANFSFCAPEKPLHPEIFMLHPLPPQPTKPVTGEDIMAAFSMFPKSEAA